MTTNPTTPKSSIEPTAASGTTVDPREAMYAAFRAAGPVIAAAEGAEAGLPTPCSEFTVGDLLAHLNSVGLRIAAMGHGGPAASVPDTTIEPNGRYAEAWSRHDADVTSTWAHLAPDDEVVTPWRALTVTEAAGIYTTEVVVHSWDLAVSIGVPFSVDAGVAEVGIAALATELPPEARADIYAAVQAQLPPDFSWVDPYGAAVPARSSDSPLDRLVAISGRSPGWPGA